MAVAVVCQNPAFPPRSLRPQLPASVLAASHTGVRGRLCPCPRLGAAGARRGSLKPAFHPHRCLSAAQLQASGLPVGTELTVGVAVACYLALEGADVSYANHRGQSPLDLAAEGRVLKALQGCAQRFR